MPAPTALDTLRHAIRSVHLEPEDAALARLRKIGRAHV